MKKLTLEMKAREVARLLSENKITVCDALLQLSIINSSLKDIEELEIVKSDEMGFFSLEDFIPGKKHV